MTFCSIWAVCMGKYGSPRTAKILTGGLTAKISNFRLTGLSTGLKSFPSTGLSTRLSTRLSTGFGWRLEDGGSLRSRF